MEESHDRVEIIEEEPNQIAPLDKEKDEDTEEAPEIQEKSFLERVSDLISSLRSVEGFDDNSGLVSFETVVETTNKKTGEQRENLENVMRHAFERFYMENRKHLLEEKMEFLAKDGHIIKVGSSGKAHIPLSDIYRDLSETNPELIDSVDAGLYFVMQHVCPDEDLEVILGICKEFEPEQEAVPGNFLGFIGNIVGRVSSKINESTARNLESEDGSINTAEVGNVVQDLICDGEIRQSMQNMMASVTGEDFDINSVVQGLFNMTGKQ